MHPTGRSGQVCYQEWPRAMKNLCLNLLLNLAATCITFSLEGIGNVADIHYRCIPISFTKEFIRNYYLFVYIKTYLD